MKREIVLDTETTGLRPEQGHRLVEICAMEIVNGKKTGEVFHKYINPQRDVPYEAFAIHGLSTEFLMDKPLFSQIAKEFIQFIKGAKLVIHNAKFDVGFLNYELKKHSHEIIDFDNVIDTLFLARKKFPGSPASLDALCKRFKISLVKREKHGALIDVELLYEVYKNLIDDSFLIRNNNEIEKINNKENKEKLVIKIKEYKNPIIFDISQEELENHKELLNRIKNPLWNI